MSVKRSRIVRSSSSGDTGVINQLSSPSPDSPELRWHIRTALAFSGASSRPNSSSSTAAAVGAQAPKQCVSPPRSSPPPRPHPPSTPGILTVSSPATTDEPSEEQVGNFLEKCFYCKKTIGHQDEVFMYGHLRAFCSPECRENQVMMDKIWETRSKKSPRSGRRSTS